MAHVLCDTCRAYFNFASTDSVEEFLQAKKRAVESATRRNLDHTLVQNLQDELERYRNETEAISQMPGSVYPTAVCPWNLKDETDYLQYNGVAAGLTLWEIDLPGRTWVDLKKSAASNECQMCEALVAMTQNAAGEKIQDTSTLSGTMYFDKATSRLRWLSFKVKEDGVRLAWLKFDIAVEDTDALRFPMQLTNPIGTSTEDESCMEFCTRALETCLSEHVACRMHKREAWVPTRLLDIHPGFTQHDTIRLVQTHNLPVGTALDELKYLTLSHVWGLAQPMKLTTANLVDLEKGVNFNNLPRKFQDVVQVARRLRIRYLWIDSLCIIQDLPEDWLHESSVMGKVYSQGICNISACNGEDSSASLFSTRKPATGRPIVFKQRYSKCSVRFSLIPDWVTLVRGHAKLYSRGWVLQERFLSPRIIHFADFLLWECHTSLTTETYSSTTKPLRLAFPYLPESERDSMFSSKSPKDYSLAHRWWRLVRTYTRSKLTYQSDRLVAISGIAQAFSKIIQEPYFAGIWGGDKIILSLLWVASIHSFDRSLPTEYRAPSWSWASVNAEVYNDAFLSISQSLIQIVSINTEPRHGNVYGEIRGGELILKGFCIEILDFSERLGSLVSSTECRLDDQHSVDPKPTFFVPFAVVEDDFPPPGTIVCGIYIQRESHKGRDVFRRVGCGWFSKRSDTHILSLDLWTKLGDLSQPDVYGEELIIV